MLNNEPRPEGQREDYLFLSSQASGRRFKALRSTAFTHQGDLVLCLSIAPIDEGGKALLDGAGQPDITPHSHTITSVELSAEGFDPEAMIAALLAQMVTVKDRELDNRERTERLVASAWSTLDLSRAGRPESDRR